MIDRARQIVMCGFFQFPLRGLVFPFESFKKGYRFFHLG